MTYRQLRAKEPQEQAQNVSTESELSPEQVAAYFRQSSSHQVRNNLESIDLQLSGAQRFAISRGLEADKLVIAHEGDGVRGVSASKLRIDQRARLQEVMAGIYAGKIKVVWAYSVSRLFRDKFGVQVGTFIQACAEHGVKVVIDQMVFDFSDPFVGPMHTAMFQFAAIMAAKENEDRSKLLHEAQKNRALRGQYDGRPLCPGFIVDRDKHSPTYGRYIPYQPHVEVVNRLLKRYREIGGRFNQLAYEVEQIRVVFPPFDDSVDKLNRSRFQLAEVCSVHGPNRQTRVKDKDGKWHFERVGCNLEGPNCQLEGYHIGSEALSHLLQAVELVGYWKVDKAVLTDDSGQPVKNHKGIVNFSDWEYSFYRMSPTLLDGSPNPDWINSRATWTAATTKQVEREPQVLLLDGLLTSPIGSVHYVPSEDAYAVFEKRRLNSHQRSKTLEINAHWIEFEFRRRLLDRIEDTDYEQMLYAALRDVQAHNAQALVSVDEQIANYEQTIKIKQAKLDALGEKFDKPTAEQYNQDILDARANIAALVAKKNEAAVEEQDLPCKSCVKSYGTLETTGRGPMRSSHVSSSSPRAKSASTSTVVILSGSPSSGALPFPRSMCATSTANQAASLDGTRRRSAT